MKKFCFIMQFSVLNEDLSSYDIVKQALGTALLKIGP